MLFQYNLAYFVPVCLLSYLFFAFVWGKTISRGSKVKQWIHLLGFITSVLVMGVYAELFPDYQDDPLINAVASLMVGFCALIVRLSFSKSVE